MDYTNIEKRLPVLKVSLMLEEVASLFLAKLVGVDKPSQSFSLSNKSTALSFNQKIHLLIDIGALNSEDRVKFITFMEIRNQFVHNNRADDVEKCLSFLSGKDKYLLKIYPQENLLSRSTQLELAVNDLSEDVFTISVNLSNKVRAKSASKIEAQYNLMSLYFMIEGLKDTRSDFLKKIDLEIEKGTTFTALELKQHIESFYNSIYSNGRKKLGIGEIDSAP